MQAAIADLIVEHDVFWSRGQIGFTEFPPGEREHIRRPRSGWCGRVGIGAEDALFVGPRVTCGRLAGGGRPAAAGGSDGHATQPQFIYATTGRWGIW